MTFLTPGQHICHPGRVYTLSVKQGLLAIDHRKLSKLMNGGSTKGKKRCLVVLNCLPQGSKVLLTLVLSWFHEVSLHKHQKNVNETKHNNNKTQLCLVMPQFALGAENFK